MSRGKSTRRGASSPLAASAKVLDRNIAKASTKATELRAKADELDASVEPLKAAREALGNVAEGTTAAQPRGK